MVVRGWEGWMNRLESKWEATAERIEIRLALEEKDLSAEGVEVVGRKMEM